MKVVLSWVEHHAWSVDASAMSTDKDDQIRRSMERAISESGIFMRYGVVPKSIKFSVEDN